MKYCCNAVETSDGTFECISGSADETLESSTCYIQDNYTVYALYQLT